MRVQALLFVSAYVTLLAQGAPLMEHEPRLLAPKVTVPKIKGGSGSTGGGLLGSLFGGKKAPPPKVTPAATTPVLKTPTVVKSTPVASTLSASVKASSATSAATSVVTTASASATSSVVSSSTTTSSDAATSSAASCPLYASADAIDISERDFAELGKRAKEEYWFRFEDPGVVNAGDNILQLATRSSTKAFDDQAYKWISTDVSKVTRGKIANRVATVYVLPAGTRQATLAAAKKFEETSAAQEAVDFVTKDNEPGDVGINGVQADAGGALPLDTFRNKVIRTVVKTVSAKAGGKATFTTITKGKKSNGASKDDQKALLPFC